MTSARSRSDAAERAPWVIRIIMAGRAGGRGWDGERLVLTGSFEAQISARFCCAAFRWSTAFRRNLRIARRLKAGLQ